MTDPLPLHVCEACGTVSDRIVAVARRLEEKEDLIDHLGSELTKLRRQVAFLQAERDEAMDTSPFAKDARQVFNYWRKTLAPKAREFSGKRKEAVFARLRAGATLEEIMEAIDGCAVRPFVGPRGQRMEEGAPDQRNVELELICRNEAKLTYFRNLLKAAQGERPGHDLAASRAGATPRSRGTRNLQDELRPFQEALSGPLLDRLILLKGWTREAITGLGLGFDGQKVVFPIYDRDGMLVGLHRYQPNPRKRTGPKMIADGERDLFPRPERYSGGVVWLVEGEPDAVSAFSAGLQVVAVPGVATWKPGWTDRFERFDRVIVAFDADKPGRDAAYARARTLHTVVATTVIDLDRTREDGYDIGDVVREEGWEDAKDVLWALTMSASTVQPMKTDGIRLHQQALRYSDPWPTVIGALGAKGSTVRGSRPRVTANCPAHEDLHASLSIAEGDDGRVLFRCHAGCATQDVLDALGLSWSDVFAA